MTTDFKALCAELYAAVQLYTGQNPASAEIPSNQLVRQLMDAMAATAAALAQPEPQGPSDEELIQLAIDTRLYRFQATAGDPIQYEMTEQQIHAFARAVLARWSRPAIEPVPVSERLPGPEDCDELGQCWWWRDGEVAWFFCDANHRDFPLWTHWLPHHALPLPQQEVK